MEFAAFLAILIPFILIMAAHVERWRYKRQRKAERKRFQLLRRQIAA